MAVSHRWTSADLERFPEDDLRREIIDGELYVSTMPHLNLQDTCDEICTLLRIWSRVGQLGRAVSLG